MRCGGMGTLRCSTRTASALAEDGAKRGRPSSSTASSSCMSVSGCWGAAPSASAGAAAASGASMRMSSSWDSEGRGMLAAGSSGAALRAVGAGMVTMGARAGYRYMRMFTASIRRGRGSDSVPIEGSGQSDLMPLKVQNYCRP